MRISRDAMTILRDASVGILIGACVSVLALWMLVSLVMGPILYLLVMAQ